MFPVLYGAALKVHISGKVSREANHSGEEPQRVCVGTFIVTFKKSFVEPLKQPTYLENTKGYVHSGYISYRMVQHTRQRPLSENGKIHFLLDIKTVCSTLSCYVGALRNPQKFPISAQR